MRVLTHFAHSGFEYEFAKTGHEFFSIGGWDDYRRPKPDNWHVIDSPSGTYDVGVIAPAVGWQKVCAESVPVIYSMLGDNGEGAVAPDLEARCSMFVFLNNEVAARWRLGDGLKKRVVEMGFDPQEFDGYAGDGPDVLTVGWSIPSRWEKGFTQIRAVDEHVRVNLVGEGNGALRCASGPMPFGELKGAYRSHKVYLNPGCIIGISIIEAMMTGMPVVTFTPINLKDVVVDGVNGFVVDTVHGAIERIRELLGDPSLRRRLGSAARETAVRRFGLARFLSAWNALFQECAAPAGAKR